MIEHAGMFSTIDLNPDRFLDKIKLDNRRKIA
jgi:hypothetical protein